MKYAVGHAICTSDIFRSFKYDKMNLTCKESQIFNNNKNKNFFVCKVFRKMFVYIIQDIIDNNIIFQLPTGKKQCEIYVDRFTGEKFREYRHKGKWKGLDILASNFSGYQLVFNMPGIGSKRTKPIYLDPKLRDHFMERVNNEEKMMGIYFKTIKDYIPVAQELFPELTLKDLKMILNHGFRVMYMFNSFGADTLITDQKSWIYIGMLSRDSIKFFHYYKFKMIKKLRLFYKLKKIEWNGYYYFGLNEPQYQYYMSQHNSKGRKRKMFDFGNLVIYKIYDECNLRSSASKYIFRVPILTDLGFARYKKNFKTAEAELILSRDPLKFKDILLETNNYEYL